jgi:hypothetical protein
MVGKKVALSIIYIVAWLCILFTFVLPLAVGIASLRFIPISSGGFSGLTLWHVGVILFLAPCCFPVLIFLSARLEYSIGKLGKLVSSPFLARARERLMLCQYRSRVEGAG